MKLALSLLGGLLVATPTLGAELSLARQAELVRLVRQDCGSCHGMRLTGGLGSPLTATALQDRFPPSLVATVLDGRPGTAMPPWRAFLSEAEATWIVAQLQAGFPGGDP